MQSLKISVAVLGTLLSGCVAVWGGSYKITSADESGMTVQYDKALASSAKMAALARAHCKQFGKIAEPDDARMPGALLGIIEERYSCVKSSSVG